MEHEFYIDKPIGKLIRNQIQGKRSRGNRIFLLTKAKGELEVDEQRVILFNAQIILIRNKQFFSFAPHSEIQGFELMFLDSFWEKAPQSASNCKSVLFDPSAQNQSLPMNEKVQKELVFLFTTLYGEYSKEDYINKADALAAYLKIIMIKIANINHDYTERYNNQDKQQFLRFNELISESGFREHRVSRYAGMLHLSPRRLNDICKRQSGESAKAIISQYLIREAKRLLRFSSDPIKEIAFSVGFSTAEQFSHFFKTQVGLSPKKYRDSL